jgi:hypothetical protein
MQIFRYKLHFGLVLLQIYLIKVSDITNKFNNSIY